MSYNLFICSGSGIVGLEILKQFSENENAQNHFAQIRAQSKDKKGAEKIVTTNNKAEAFIFDFNDYDAAVAVFQKIDDLVIITPYSVDMLIYSGKLIEAAVEAGVDYIIHLGVPRFGNSMNINWMFWHYEVENMIENYVRQGKFKGFMHLRPYWFLENLLTYGNIKTLSREKQKLRLPFLPQVNIPWVAVEDIAKIVVQLLLHPLKYKNKVFPIVSEIDNLEHIAEIIRQETTLKELKIETPTSQEFYEQVVNAGAEPVYMKGTKTAVESINNSQLDAKKDEQAIEGIECFELVTGLAPTMIRSWVKKHIH